MGAVTTNPYAIIAIGAVSGSAMGSAVGKQWADTRKATLEKKKGGK